MKILHIELQSKTGGVASLVYDLCETQLESGHDVSVMTWLNEYKYLDSANKLGLIGVHTLKSKYKGKYSLSKILELRKLFQNYDVVHVHLFPIQLYAAIAYSLIPKNKRPVLITTEHSTYNNRRKYRILKYLDRWFYSVYDRIICISPQTKINLCSWLNKPDLNKKICTIKNGINIRKFSDAHCKPLPFVNKRDTRYIVMVSRMISPKDPVCVVKALRYCDPSIQLVLIGDGPLLEEVRKYATSCDLTNRIHIMGNVSNVDGYLKNFDIGILSTNWDGFGLVAVEYMAAGLPVIASDVDGLRDVIGKSEYLFNTGDYKQLAERINHLIEDKQYYDKSRQYFLNRATLFSYEKMGTEYLDIYENLVSKKGQNG